MWEPDVSPDTNGSQRSSGQPPKLQGDEKTVLKFIVRWYPGSRSAAAGVAVNTALVCMIVCTGTERKTGGF